MNLCGYCVADLLPLNQSMRGFATANQTGERVQYFTFQKIPQMIEEGTHTFFNASGHMLLMRAVTTVRGTLCCAQHAADEVRMSS